MLKLNCKCLSGDTVPAADTAAVAVDIRHIPAAAAAVVAADTPADRTAVDARTQGRARLAAGVPEGADAGPEAAEDTAAVADILGMPRPAMTSRDSLNRNSVAKVDFFLHQIMLQVIPYNACEYNMATN
jgi:hypothetical protein